MSSKLQGHSKSDDLNITKHHSSSDLQYTNVDTNTNNFTVNQCYPKPTTKLQTQCKLTTYFTKSYKHSDECISSESRKSPAQNSPLVHTNTTSLHSQVPPSGTSRLTASLPTQSKGSQRPQRLSDLLRSCSIQPISPPPHHTTPKQTPPANNSTAHQLPVPPTQSPSISSTPTTHRNMYKKKPVPPGTSTYTSTSSVSQVPKFSHTRSGMVHPPQRWGFTAPASIQTVESSDRTPWASDYDSTAPIYTTTNESPPPLREIIVRELEEISILTKSLSNMMAHTEATINSLQSIYANPIPLNAEIPAEVQVENSTLTQDSENESLSLHTQPPSPVSQNQSPTATLQEEENS